jgi:hypothetical protein
VVQLLMIADDNAEALAWAKWETAAEAQNIIDRRNAAKGRS